MNAVCICRLRNNIRTYLRAFGSGMSTGYIWRSILHKPDRSCQSVILQQLHRKFHIYLNSAAAQCHWSYQTLCSFCTNKWRTYVDKIPNVWCRHRTESLSRIQTFNQLEQCACGACSLTIINNTLISFGFGKTLCPSNR